MKLVVIEQAYSRESFNLNWLQNPNYNDVDQIINQTAIDWHSCALIGSG